MPPAELVAAAAEPYRNSSRFAYHWARNKLRQDPVFTQILARGLLANRARILDLGCGQGLLAAWLLAAGEPAAQRIWPPQWAAPPHPRSIRGIELMSADLLRGRRALGKVVEFIQGDICATDYGAADAVVILDVLHYLDQPSQLEVLRRAHRALAPDGLLLLRIGNADGGLRFHFSVWVDYAMKVARGMGMRRLFTRSLTAWQQTLNDCGFNSNPLPMSDGTPFANVLLLAHPK